MTRAPKGSQTIDILARLAWRKERAGAAAQLADRLGAEQVLVLIRDPAVDAMLPAPGMDQTLYGGPAWRAFLKRCNLPGRQEATVDLPADTRKPALALVWGSIALVIVGGKPDRGKLATIEPLLPMLGAALGCEEQVVVSEAEAAAARVAARHANVLARALEASRAEGAALNMRLRDEHRRKDDFLATLAHELRNPLSPLVTSVELLRQNGGDIQLVKRQLDAMARQVDQLSRLVEDLLDVSRVSHGRISLRRAVLVLSDVIAHALETSRLLIDLRHHRVTLDQVDETLLVDADWVRLTQVFANLINNAAKYSDPGSVIAISVERDGETALVRVADNGMGISEETLPRIFDLFTQAPGTRERAQGGLGIGLTLVKSLVELHGGTVKAHSPGAGKGSTFTVCLPLASRGATELQRLEPEAAAAAKQGSPQDALRVLVVDDNHDAADSMAEILRMLGHHVGVAHTGLKALQIAADFDPDLLMLDIGLPGFDGYELARRLRRLGDRHAWFVALTGYGTDDDKRRSIEAGFDEHVVKPVKLGLVKEILVRALAQRGERARP